eukprot:Gb_24387 [translate_table: standard]
MRAQSLYCRRNFHVAFHELLGLAVQRFDSPCLSSRSLSFSRSRHNCNPMDAFRLVPPLPSGYLGNPIQVVGSTLAARELLGNGNCVMMGNSPRCPMYWNDFEWGQPITVRSGCANKFDGKISHWGNNSAARVLAFKT